MDKTSSGEPIFQLQDGFLKNPEPHVCYDAWLALRISKPFTEDLVLEVENFDMADLNTKVFELAA